MIFTSTPYDTCHFVATILLLVTLGSFMVNDAHGGSLHFQRLGFVVQWTTKGRFLFEKYTPYSNLYYA